MRSAIAATLTAGLAVVALSTTVGAAGLNIDRVAGVYKKTFANGNISGEKYQSENILEIVKVSPTTAYVRTHLEFFNGHVCDIWGVANVDNDALVYTGEVNSQGKRCLLTLKVSGGAMTIVDPDGACAISTCGARGMYNKTAFDMNKRRAIRYLEIIRKSQQYKDAIEEREKAAR